MAQYPKTTQIKATLNVETKDLTSLDLERLQAFVNSGCPFNYKHGFVRGNYVSQIKNWKTTVFVISNEEAIELLEKVCFIVSESFRA